MKLEHFPSYFEFNTIETHISFLNQFNPSIPIIKIFSLHVGYLLKLRKLTSSRWCGTILTIINLYLDHELYSPYFFFLYA